MFRSPTACEARYQCPNNQVNDDIEAFDQHRGMCNWLAGEISAEVFASGEDLDRLNRTYDAFENCPVELVKAAARNAETVMEASRA